MLLGTGQECGDGDEKNMPLSGTLPRSPWWKARGWGLGFRTWTGNEGTGVLSCKLDERSCPGIIHLRREA